MDNIEVVDVDSLYAELMDNRKQELLLSHRIAEQELKNVQKLLAEAQSKAINAEERLERLFCNLECKGVTELNEPLRSLDEAIERITGCYASIGNRLNDINRAKAKEA